MKKKDYSSSSRNSFRDKLNRNEEFSPLVSSNFPPPTLEVEGVEKYQKIQSLDVSLTIRTKVELTRRQATLLAGQAIFEIISEGITLGDWMVIEFLYGFLLGQKQDFLRVKNSKELEILALLKLVLLSGTWIGLEGKSQLPDDIKFLLSNSQWIPSERTYFSRKKSFELKKFLEVRIVSTDDLMTRSSGTKRYSSYCKGYGEGSSRARREKTLPSAELDGEEVNLEKEEHNNVPILLVSTLSQLYLLEVREKIRKFSK